MPDVAELLKQRKYAPRVKMPDNVAMEIHRKLAAGMAAGKHLDTVAQEIGITHNRANYIMYGPRFAKVKKRKQSGIISVLGPDEPKKLGNKHEVNGFTLGFQLGRYATENGLTLSDLIAILSEKEK